jgi:hypothetical protein
MSEIKNEKLLMINARADAMTYLICYILTQEMCSFALADAFILAGLNSCRSWSATSDKENISVCKL